ncbi:MAG: zinc-binding dehydrogenase [Candidatus Melainabacteria bacterium]
MSAPAVLPGTMHAARFHAPRQVAWEEVPLRLPGPGELLVRMRAALTCGTDVKCYRRGHPVLLKNFPSPFGHEGAGVVAAVGAGVTAFAVGDAVVSANSAPCGGCFFCRQGQENLCESLDLLNGTYAEYLLVPAPIVVRNTYRLPPDFPSEKAAFAEPLAIALRGVAVSRIEPGMHVAVIGPGPIGLLLAVAATGMGAVVTVLGRSAHKLALARSFAGAAHTVDVSGGCDADRVRSELTEAGRGFDRVIEAVGQPETWGLAVDLVRRGGLVNLFGGCPAGTTVPVDTRRLHYDEITLVSAFHHTPADMAAAVSALVSGRIDPTPLITSRMPMAGFEDALLQMERGQALKVALLNA